MAFTKGQRFTLKRPFWGHQPGTRGRITQAHPESPVNRYTGKFKLRGSPLASVRDTDVNDLLEPVPEGVVNSMSDEIKQIATRVVDRLLGEEWASSEEFEKRPGGTKDPYRQTTVKMAFKKGDFSGKRGTAPVASSPGGVKKKKKGDGESGGTSRFNLKFSECRSAEGSAGKAWKKGKKMSGKSVAGKPGKVSYKEALMRSVLEKIAVKKAMKQGKKAKGQMVAGKPGKVSYRGEQQEQPGLDEAKGGGMKGVKAKKMLNTIAKKPGKVGFGKK